MKVETVLISSLLLLFTVFLFPDYITAIDGISSSNALKPVFVTIPIILMIVELYFFVKGVTNE